LMEVVAGAEEEFFGEGGEMVAGGFWVRGDEGWRDEGMGRQGARGGTGGLVPVGR
jgi:hypothetical protein